MPPTDPLAVCLATRHRPSRVVTVEAGVRRSRCVACGLRLMRTGVSRRWIIADLLG